MPPRRSTRPKRPSSQSLESLVASPPRRRRTAAPSLPASGSDSETCPNCFLAKTDVKNAFRLVPIRPEDYDLLGIYWQGLIVHNFVKHVKKIGVEARM